MSEKDEKELCDTYPTCSQGACGYDVSWRIAHVESGKRAFACNAHLADVCGEMPARGNLHLSSYHEDR